MAATGESKSNFQLVHGSRKYEVQMSDEDAGDEELSVSHLAQQVAKITGVPVEKQKLIFKGKSLSEPEQTLKSVGLKNGSKIMLIGKKFSEEDERLMKTITKVEDTVSQCNSKISSAISELDGISQGFLGQDKEKESLKKLVRKFGATGEELAKQLEQLDALSLQDAATDVKQKRKSLVDKINKALDVCDKKTEEGKTMLERISS